MKQYRDLYKQAIAGGETEDAELWMDQILNLQGELFDGEELQRQQAEMEAEEARLAEEAA